MVKSGEGDERDGGLILVWTLGKVKTRFDHVGDLGGGKKAKPRFIVG
jgi:hypothetical protein